MLILTPAFREYKYRYVLYWNTSYWQSYRDPIRRHFHFSTQKFSLTLSLECPRWLSWCEPLCPSDWLSSRHVTAVQAIYPLSQMTALAHTRYHMPWGMPWHVRVQRKSTRAIPNFWWYHAGLGIDKCSLATRSGVKDLCHHWLMACCLFGTKPLPEPIPTYCQRGH